MPRSIESWRNIIMRDGLTTKLANDVLADLVGYRGNTRWRSDDIDTLFNLFSAIKEAVIHREVD